MSNINEKLDGFTRKYLETELSKRIKDDPKLSTNPKMAEIYSRGFYAGASAEGDAICIIFAQSDKVKEEQDADHPT